VLETRTVSSIVVLDTAGRAYTIRASEVPGGRSDGVPVTTLIDLQGGAKVGHAITGESEQKYLVAGSGGYGFIASFGNMLSRVKAGKTFMTLTPDEVPLAPVALASGLDHVAGFLRADAYLSSPSTRCAKFLAAAASSSWDWKARSD